MNDAPATVERGESAPRSDTMSDAPASEPKKGKSPMLLIIIAVVVLGGGGAAAYFMLAGGKSAPHPAAEGEEAKPKAEGEAEGASGAHKPTMGGGPIAEFQSIIVNLNEPEGTRYLKTTVAISLSDEKLVAEVDRLKPVIKDQFIRELSELNFRQTMGAKNKLAIKRRLLKRFNELLGPDAGTDLFLTEFIVQ